MCSYAGFTSFSLDSTQAGEDGRRNHTVLGDVRESFVRMGVTVFIAVLVELVHKDLHCAIRFLLVIFTKTKGGRDRNLSECNVKEFLSVFHHGFEL